MKIVNGVIAAITLGVGYSAPAIAHQYSDCSQYSTFEVGGDSDNQKVLATAILNGALDRMQDDTPTAADNSLRDWCVAQALGRGADSNNSQGYSLPIIIAVGNSDESAVVSLLKYKANPNAADTGLGLSDNSIPVLNTACGKANDSIILDLLAAGANPVLQEPLWLSASSADDVAVQALLNTGKIPVNQLSTFGSGDLSDSQTALDASEQRVAAINSYFTDNAGKSADDKRMSVNNTLLFGYYVGFKQIANDVDPDQYVKNLQVKQQHVSSLLKSKGWTCSESNCGVLQDSE